MKIVLIGGPYEGILSKIPKDQTLIILNGESYIKHQEGLFVHDSIVDEDDKVSKAVLDFAMSL